MLRQRMSRRRAAIKRQILPDAKYGSILVAKFMNCLMKDGKIMNSVMSETQHPTEVDKHLHVL